MGDQHLAAAYTHIYAFLKSRDHNDVAKALKKAAKGVVILKDPQDNSIPSLDKIIQEWKIYRDKAQEKSTSDDSDSSSDDSSSSSKSSDLSSSKDASARKKKQGGASSLVKSKMKKQRNPKSQLQPPTPMIQIQTVPLTNLLHLRRTTKRKIRPQNNASPVLLFLAIQKKERRRKRRRHLVGS
ncbi:hypothetical protein J3R30DRAFT_583861 [Lentinula aciculospora]|uniref:Uncharacterized protein n=1 Tax=Lentinula aciculospora TaxID=153920 RepID=A0A9W9A7V0_9AGAR|nr:hypothetical protein J3R30DRAFT_583861 [Lentinula aciculospora]